MTSSSTVRTAYGLVDEQGLLDLQNSYDTRQLLAIADDLDRLIGRWKREDGLRDAVLRLHGMAHALINGARLTSSSSRETLPELAWDIASDLREAVDTLQRWIRLLEPLEELQPRD